MTKLIPRHTRQIAVISNSLLVVGLSRRPNFLTSEMSVALITVTVVNLLVSPLTIFSHTCCTCCQDNTSAEKQMQRFADLFRVTDILTGALGQPLFVSELIYRLTDTSRPHQIFFPTPYVARHFLRTSLRSAHQYLVLISIERYTSF